VSEKSIIEAALSQSLFTTAHIGYQSTNNREVTKWGATEGELFDIASLTKLFTTTAILRLVDTKKLFLSTPVSTLLPHLGKEASTLLSAIDITQLLSHHSTLPAWYPFYVHLNDSYDKIIVKAVNRLGPSIGMCYSDLNFIILGKIIEELTQSSLSEALDTLVCSPLDLTETTFTPQKNRCVPTELGNKIEQSMVNDLNFNFDNWRRDEIQGEVNDGNAFYYFGGVAGHAGLFSTVDDLLALGKAYVEDFISPKLLSKVFIDYGEGRGLGWHLGELYPNGGWGHTGFTGTYLAIQRNKKSIVTILTNRLHVPTPVSINSFRIDLATHYFTR